MADNSLKTQAFNLKGRLYTLTVFQLLTTDRQALSSQLSKFIQQAPKMLKFTPIVMDLSAVRLNADDFVTIYQWLRSNELIPVAIQNANEIIREKANDLGLAILSSKSIQDKTVIIEKPVEKTVKKTAKKAAIKPTKLIKSPVRSGQQIYAKDSDLIVIGAVSHGAELLADGNIHVYGPLRGRALAGIKGNKDAYIFCQSLDAELVSVAGQYVLSDDMIKHKNSAKRVYLKGERLIIEDL
jgi:septum site-determining protein MinC